MALAAGRWLAVFAGFAAFFAIFFLPAEIGRLMASGDALVESLPAYLGAHRLWEPTMLLGYPLFADPNQQYWYPLSLLHLIPNSYNAFAVSPFVFAAVGMAGFVWTVTRSTVGAIVAGLVFSLGGFFISHAGHLMLTHPAAFAPYVLWAIESQRRRPHSYLVVGGAAAVGLCAVAGQPQIAVFSATLALLYALVSGFRPGVHRIRFLGLVVMTLVLGIALAGVQLVPEIVLAHESTRASIDFERFIDYQIPAGQIAMRVAFPYALGGTALPWYAFSREDLGTFTEETIAIGLVSLALAVAAYRSFVFDRRVAFWAAVAVAALFLAVGDATPLARLTHYLVPYGLFRAPGRHSFEWSFAIAVLAGYGTADMVRRRASIVPFVVGIALAAVFAAVGYAQFVEAPLRQVVATYAVDAHRVASPLTNGALGLPLATGAIAIATVLIAIRLAGSRVAGTLVIFAVALDMSAFGWPAYWNWAAVTPQALSPSSAVLSLAKRSRTSATRLAFLPGALDPELAPNLTTLWNIDGAGGYTPLVRRPVATLLGVTSSGGVTMRSDPRDGSLDIAGANPVVSLSEPLQTVTATNPFAASDIHVFISSRGVDATSLASFGLPAPRPATSVGLVSELGDGMLVLQGTRVADLDVIFVDGHRERAAIVAGRDTAEFAYDRADVRPSVRHLRARIFSGDATTHRYVSYFHVTSKAPVARVEIAWRPAHSAERVGLTVDKLSLIDARDQTAATFGFLATLYADPQHWRPIASSPAFAAFENERALPRVWFARPISIDGAEEALRVIETATLPDGTKFDERREALVERDVPATEFPDRNDRADIVDDSAGRLDVSTSCTRPCFLAVRNACDSNWRVTLDGRAAILIPTDVAIVGVSIPAGVHRVRFRFVPMSLYLGIAVTGFACLLAGVIVLRRAHRSRKPNARSEKVLAAVGDEHRPRDVRR